MWVKGRTTIERRGGSGFSPAGAGGAGPDGLGDVLEPSIAEIVDRDLESRFHLTIGVL
jgi:hypothetical protein